MTIFEVGALIIVGLAVLDGALSGFFWALLELGMLLVAGLLTTLLNPLLAPLVRNALNSPEKDAVCFTQVVVFAALAIVLLVALFIIHPKTKDWRFDKDRWLGGVLGVLSGGLASLLFLSFALWSSPRSYEDSLKESWLVPVLDVAHDSGFAWFFQPDLDRRLREVREP